MNYIILLMAMTAVVISSNSYLQVRREKKRNRILQSFVAGVIRSFGDHCCKTDNNTLENAPEQNTQLPHYYRKILDNIQQEFLRDFWIKPYEEWLKRDRSIFNDERYSNGGFNDVYLDFFDDLLKKHNSRELLPENDKSMLDEGVEVMEDNIAELKGEIAMYRDLLKGELDDSNFTKENIDDRLFLHFRHIKRVYRDNLKNEILKRRKSHK